MHKMDLKTVIVAEFENIRNNYENETTVNLKIKVAKTDYFVIWKLTSLLISIKNLPLLPKVVCSFSL